MIDHMPADELNRYISEYRESQRGVTSYMGSDALDGIREYSTHMSPLLGVDMNREPVTADFHTDSPHLLFSMGSGAGKSVAVRNVLAQGMAHGGEAVILDFKWHSHRWTRHLRRDCPTGVNREGCKECPACRLVYCKSVASIHATLVALGAICERRNELADSLSDEEYERGDAVGRPILIAAEELNATIAAIEGWWRSTGGKGVSPGLLAFRQILAMGRAVRIHVIAVAQRASAAATGGGDARENFGTRVMARYTYRTWKMLLDGAEWIAPSEIMGRAVVAKRLDVMPTQLVYLSDSPNGGDTVRLANGEIL